MKTALLFSAGADSSYLAYKILHDTSDDLTLFLLTTRNNERTPYVPPWVAQPDRLNKMYDVINELKKIRDFDVHHELVDSNTVSFPLDNPVPYGVNAAIPKINSGEYDRIAIGYSWDQHSLRYFKRLNVKGVSGDKISKKIFDKNATRGELWSPLMTHEIHDRYGKYHAMKYLPQEFRSKILSCDVPTKGIGCGSCGKCTINIKVEELMKKSYSSDDVNDWFAERSLIFGGNDRCASPLFWVRLLHHGRMTVATGVSIPEEQNKNYVITNREEFVRWWNTMEFNPPADNVIKKWNKDIKDYLEILI